MKITVAIPTYRRAELLRSALASVRNQSRQDLIAEVIVSENSDDRGSLAVVSEFPDLPIRHVFQHPPTDSGKHFARIVDLSTSDWVAVLGDDDMWGRYHLEDAARGLAANPEAVAYAGQFVYTTTDGRTATGGAAYLLGENLEGRNKTFQDYWVFDRLQVGVESLLLTPLNMWAVVGRRTALAAAFKAYSEPGAGYDSDRYMFWLLAHEGPLVVGREVGLFYRFHGDNACERFLRENPGYHARMAGEYTKRIIRAAEEEGLPLKQAWLAAMRAAPPERRQNYWRLATPGAGAAILETWADDVQDLLPVHRKSFVKQLVVDLSPPLLLRWVVRAKRWLLGQA